MKKFASMVLTVVFVLGMLTLTACGSKVDGTYKYESFTVENLSSEENSMISSLIDNAVSEAFGGMSIILKDGKAQLDSVSARKDIGEYTVEGNTVIINESKYTYDNGKLIYSYTVMGYTAKIVFKK